MSKRTAELLLQIFDGNSYHAQARIRDDGRGIWYDLIEYPIDQELMMSHLMGELTLGSYPIRREDNTVKWVCWDIDSAGDIEKAREVATKIINRVSHLPYAVEFSGNKGYHIFLFLDSPVPASKAREVVEYIRDSEKLPKSGNPHVEAYPKQSVLNISDDGTRRPAGNLLKVPLGIHPITHNFSIFIDPRNGWENGPPIAAEEVLRWRISAEELLALKDEGIGAIDRLATAVSTEWVEGHRHELCLYLAGYLAQIGWTFERTIDLTERILKIRSDDTDHTNRLQAVRDTFSKYSKNLPVAGFQSLTQILSGGLIKIITEEAPLMSCPTIARQIDNIRFGKGASWEKVRKITTLIWGWLMDTESGGQILRVSLSKTGNELKVYWFNKSTRLVMDLNSPSFDDILYREFHLSIAEEFVSQIKQQLILKSRSGGKSTKIYQRSIFLDGKLYINLGGIEIYVLDGVNAPTILLNGDEGIYFITNNPTAPRLDFESRLDIWEELVDNISFETHEEAPMKPAEQKELLKAWIIAFFFRNIMPTRPILTLLGAPGSGKTTSIRQIMRMIEGLDQDVASIVDEKSDAWRSMLEHKSMIVLDNMEEAQARWISRALDLVATGSSIEVRKLYTTNEMYVIKPDVFVALTAVEMPFSKATVFERMLVLNMQKLKSYTPSYLIEESLREHVNEIWSDLLYKLNEVVAMLAAKKTTKLAMNVRMADFALFCHRVKDCSFFDKKELENGLKYLSTAQQAALALSEHSVYPLLQEWIEQKPEEAVVPKKIGELFDILSTMARQKQRNFHWKTAQALSHHLSAMEAALHQALGMEIELKYSSAKGRNERYFVFKILEVPKPTELLDTDKENPFTIDFKRITGRNKNGY